MRFSYTHHMPYTDVTDPGPDWPVGNKRFDGARGVEMFRSYIADKIYAEQAGFDWIASNEHHMSPYWLMPNPNLIGAVVAHQTTRAGILQSGNILPIVNPIRVAEEYAMLDVLSGGRLIAGFMRGIPHEYVAYNTAPDESYGRMAEGVELIKRCWTEPEPFGWEGEHFQFRAVSIWPKPVQKPMPPILMSVNS
jgi:alkanesulfonate monooxygenase SsuD/methylene tetrahydromethanopterin reductase-like flavin-dependent oxidoreductase (luciferase family)